MCLRKTGKTSVFFRNSKGQNMVEYLLVFAAVVAVLFVFLKPKGYFSKAMSDTMDQSVDLLNSVKDSFEE